MAEGGFDPTDPTTEKTPLIPSAGDDDDGEDNTGLDWDNIDWNVSIDLKQPFEPGATSTPADVHRLDRELYLQSRRLSSILPGGALMAAHPCRGGLLHGKTAQEEEE